MPRISAGMLAGILGTLLVSCSNPTITTPTRTLDRPSDVALYCVEIEVPDCLPDADPELDPQAYLDAYCDQSTIDYSNNTFPSATVLTLDECDQDHRSERNNFYLTKVYKAARLLGRDPNIPCCDGDNPTCGDPAPVCSRRMLAALVVNTARGELAVADTEVQAPGLPTVGRLENLHGGEPGFGFLPIGLQPEHVRSYSPQSGTGIDGRKESGFAWAVTANAGSCDLSTVELQPIASLANHPGFCDLPNNWCESRACDANTCPLRVQPFLPGPSGSTRPLQARPAWIEIAPWSQGISQRRAVIASYPTCGVIAAIDLGCTNGASPECQTGPGRVVDAVRFDSSGQAHVLSATELQNLDCAADCGGDTGGGGLMPDPTTLPDGGVPLVSSYPVSLALEATSQRMLVSDAVGDAVTVVDFDVKAGDGNHFRGTPRRIALDFNVLPESLRGGQKGLNSIRISPRTPAGQFAYVAAADSSVRVIDLDRELECETNPEPRYLQAHAGDTMRVLPDELNDSNQRRLSCFPVGATQTPRSPLAFGPGITLPNGSLPRDIGFVHADIAACDVTDGANCSFAPNAISDIWIQARTALWVGDFAWILGGSGMVTSVQMADNCPSPSYRACYPDSAAIRRIFFLHTKSQALASPEVENLPTFNQALMVSPSDRLGNVRRTLSRFEDPGQFGPRTDNDSAGLPIFTTLVTGVAVAYSNVLSDPDIPAGRPRLSLPTPAPYYYLPVDPVCDVALVDQANTRISPDGILPLEPTRRPVAMANFTNNQAMIDNTWAFDWEGALAGLSRTTGTMYPDGTLIDLNGLYCSRGVEVGDKVRLSGCLTDSDCLLGEYCQLEPTQGTNPGVCLTVSQRQTCHDISQKLTLQTPDDPSWLATWLRYYRVVKAEQQVPVVTGDVSDRLTLDEIPEPEYTIERQSCAKVGDVCPVNLDFSGRTSTTEPDYSCQVTDYGNWTTRTDPKLSCILRCHTNQDCGGGFVCAKSHYDNQPRCMRAPLLDITTIRSCFPDPMHYEIRAGDAFLVHGDRSGAPVLVSRAADGSCKRPQPGDVSYSASRLLEPRLRLGPRDIDDIPDTDPQRCSRDLNDWLLHRIPSSPEATNTASCRGVRDGGQVQFPLLDSVLPVAPGEKFAIQSASDDSDPWLKREYELFSSLPLADPNRFTNQCILTDGVEETYPDGKTMATCQHTCAMAGDTVCPTGVCTKAGDTCSVGLCRFPGDHIEALGVRRIHYETAYGNIVMRLPRVMVHLVDPMFPNDTTKARDVSAWVVPPDGYSVSFTVYGSLTTYEVPAQSAAQDVSSGVLAQGLRTAVGAPSGVLFLVDEGRNGSLTSLRGQVLRMVGSQIDPVFLLR